MFDIPILESKVYTDVQSFAHAEEFLRKENSRDHYIFVCLYFNKFAED